MLQSLKNVFKIADLRNKILFTLALLLVYRLGSYIPVPGVDFTAVQEFKKSAEQGGVFGFLALFSGGALTQFAVFALGIMPYITASIIMQILAVVIPKLEQWQNQGAVGQRKITQWTRYVTIAIAAMQATGLSFVLHNGGGGFGSVQNTSGQDLLPNFDVWHVLLVVITLSAATALLMWMGELITQKGIGNGMSLLIFASVVSSLPGQLGTIKSEGDWGAVIAVMIGFALILLAIVFVEQGQRRIPVQFAKRVVGRRMIGGQSTYIPLKVNQSGVIPIIFASSVLYLPQLLTLVLPSEQNNPDFWGNKVQRWVDEYVVKPDSLVHMTIFFLLILAFAYFYTAITFDPAKQADTIRKQGGFIPGIRPGPQTERYLAKILSRITLPGALFIAAIAIVPSFLLTRFLPGQNVLFSGISILIAVGVALETMKQIDSQLMMRNYEGFLK
ncbi:MAG: preprotein translocase subunit SecY [Acidimicrobiales bacterium]|nr:preprotein translocase subunit SecY [Acidimicrobiales bacterium]